MTKHVDFVVNHETSAAGPIQVVDTATGLASRYTLSGAHLSGPDTPQLKAIALGSRTALDIQRARVAS